MLEAGSDRTDLTDLTDLTNAYSLYGARPSSGMPSLTVAMLHCTYTQYYVESH